MASLAAEAGCMTAVRLASTWACRMPCGGNTGGQSNGIVTRWRHDVALDQIDSMQASDDLPLHLELVQTERMEAHKRPPELAQTYGHSTRQRLAVGVLGHWARPLQRVRVSRRTIESQRPILTVSSKSFTINAENRMQQPQRSRASEDPHVSERSPSARSMATKRYSESIAWIVTVNMKSPMTDTKVTISATVSSCIQYTSVAA